MVRWNYGSNGPAPPEDANSPPVGQVKLQGILRSTLAVYPPTSKRFFKLFTGSVQKQVRVNRPRKTGPGKTNLCNRHRKTSPDRLKPGKTSLCNMASCNRSADFTV